MFDINMGSHTDCDGVSRREFLRVGGLAALGLTLPDLMRATAATPGKKDVSCILLWLGGGPSQIDTFDPKPDAPQEIRGDFKSIKTKLPGVHFCEHLPKLAQINDKFSVIRSVTTPDPNHETATHYLLTGYPFNPAIEYPAYGSVVSREKGGQLGMPANIIMGGLPFAHGAGGYMGAVYNPFNISGDPNNPNFSVNDVSPPSGMTMDRVERRRDILKQVDRFQRNTEARQKVLSTSDTFYEQAFSLITSPQAKKAFDLKQEKPETRDKYGRHNFGQSCLLARRLVESGVRFVTINYGGWDNHERIFGAFKDSLLPTLDSGYSALVEDLAQRGMLDTTLVICMGEFGRTPKVNSSAGRDHWSEAMTVTMGGGGVKTGIVVGETNERSERPKERPIKVEDVAATIYKSLGVDCEKEYMSPENRPLKINYDGTPVHELI
jgi:uncharacterized protein (DUF1501 family)